MANLKIVWALPTTRRSGRPLDPAQIDRVEIALSADAGANFSVIDALPPEVLETIVQDIDPGTWLVRGIVYDTAGRASLPTVDSITVEDTTPPGELTLTLSLV